MFDVIISGAGPSGSQCAELLAKKGFKIALIEKNTGWRKPCGGALNHRILDFYPKLRKLNLAKIQGIAMHSANYHKLEYRVGESLRGTIMDRLDFDNFLRDIAIDAGAELFDKNLSYEFITKNQKKVGIKTKCSSGTKEFFGKIFIIADGMSSKLALKSGLREKWKIMEVANGKCALMKGKHQLDEQFIYIYFMPYKGYGWIFPLNEKLINIGIYTFAEDNLTYNLNEVYQKFITNSNIQKQLFSHDYKMIWSGSYPFPVEGVLEKSLYDENIMLIGDTAGFVSPISGEGIQHALTSGKVAAQTAINALEIEDISKSVLKQYRSHPEIKKIVRSFKLKRSMRELFYVNNGEDFNRILELTEQNSEFKNQIVDIFMSRKIPDKEFFSMIK